MQRMYLFLLVLLSIQLIGCSSSMTLVNQAEVERVRPGVHRYNSGYCKDSFISASASFDAYTRHYFIGTSETEKDDYAAANSGNMNVVHNENSFSVSAKGVTCAGKYAIGMYGNVGYSPRGRFGTFGMEYGVVDGTEMSFMANFGVGAVSNKTYASYQEYWGGFDSIAYRDDSNTSDIMSETPSFEPSSFVEIGAAMSYISADPQNEFIISFGGEIKSFIGKPYYTGYDIGIITLQGYYPLTKNFIVSANVDYNTMIMNTMDNVPYFSSGAMITILVEPTDWLYSQ